MIVKCLLVDVKYNFVKYLETAMLMIKLDIC